MRLQGRRYWDEVAKDRCMEVYKEEKRRAKKDVNKHFGRKMNQYVNRNRKLFWKKVNNVNEGKIKNENGCWH